MGCVSFGLCIIISAALAVIPSSVFATTPALILTPYITKNQTQEARNLSLVDPSLFLNVTSHSGFLTVDERYGSNTFFWYFPVANKPVNETPWIIWLQGGPGASSLFGLFKEMGPFQYDGGTLNLREFSWWKEYSMVFIDNPVGAGFSFTNSDKGFVSDMAMYSNHLYTAVEQFVTLFPELRKAPLYIAGESYAGRYVPGLGAKILENSKPDNLTVNLKGLIMGNPILNRDDVADLTSSFYQWGLIDSQGVLAAKPLQDKYSKAIKDGKQQEAYDLRDKLLTKLQNIASQDMLYNSIFDSYRDFHGFEEFIGREDVREAIHVGHIKFTFSNSSVHTYIVPDFLTEVQTKVESLLEHYNILIYCGQLDLTAPCVPNAEARRQKWHWSQRDNFMHAPRLPWWFNETVSGYVKSGGGFTEVLVRGSGHLVPIDKPAQAQQLISYFIRGITLPMPPNYVFEDTPEFVIQHKAAEPSNTSLIASVTMNFVLSLFIIAGVLLYYIRKRKKSRDFYASVDNISDDIFLS